MSTTTSSLTGRGVVASGAIAGAVAGLVNLVVLFVGKAVGVSYEVETGGTTMEVPVVMPFVASFVAILLGSLLLKVIGRSARGITIWTAVALVFFAAYTAFAFSAANDLGTGLALALMHVVALAAAFALVVPAARRAVA